VLAEAAVVGLSKAEEVRDDEGGDERDAEEIGASPAVKAVERARDVGSAERVIGIG
jgi:hypothetical protein